MTSTDRTTWVLVDGENIDATLGGSILGRRPQPDERPRWDRVLSFLARTWHQQSRGLFFLNASTNLPMPFIQALLALGYQPVPLSGSTARCPPAAIATPRSRAPSTYPATLSRWAASR